MPNECSISITVTLPKEEYKGKFDDFIAALINEDGFPSFKRLVPLVVGSSSETLAKWGTKWDIDNEESWVEIKEDTLKFSACTAWSPPVEWLETVSRMYPELKFHMTYEEPGNYIAGIVNAYDNSFMHDFYDGDEAEGYIKYVVANLGYDEEEARDMYGEDE